MNETIAEGTIGLFVKVGILFSAWMVSFQQSVVEVISTDEYIDRAFDTAFSLGLLILFVVYMIYENRVKDKRKELAQSENVELLRTNIEVIRSFTTSNNDIVKSIERTQETTEKSMQQLSKENTTALENLTSVINKLESKL